MLTAYKTVAEASFKAVDFSSLSGWADDDHAAALKAFQTSCNALSETDWVHACAAGADASDARAFFEEYFQPVLIEDGQPGLFTAYYEPELPGSIIPTAKYNTPLYALPDEAQSTEPWLPRKTLIESGVLENRGLELVWLEDAVELFFLQVQGSGRIRLDDGRVMRVGYAGTNGQPYRSIGRALIEQDAMTVHEANADAIKAWVRANPIEGRALLYHNTSYVFFREVTDVPSDLGPIGAMNRSITTMRSIAVDPAFVPLGAPVWIEKAGQAPLHRLMVAQDTGSAIKGAQRADVFFGTGDAAGQAAGRIKDPGRLVTLLPLDMAATLVGEAQP